MREYSLRSILAFSLFFENLVIDKKLLTFFWTQNHCFRELNEQAFSRLGQALSEIRERLGSHL